MKTLVVSVVAVFTLGVLCAADEQPVVSETSAAKSVTLKGFNQGKKLTPEEKEAKIAEMKLKQQERMAARRKAMEAKMAAAEEAVAKKKGISVEELRRQRDEKMAAAAGMTVEEWSKLDKEAQNAKMREVFKAKKLERDQKAAEKAGVSLEEYLSQRDEKRKAKNLERKAKKDLLKPMPGAKLVDDPKNTEAGK